VGGSKRLAATRTDRHVAQTKALRSRTRDVGHIAQALCFRAQGGGCNEKRLWFRAQGLGIRA
jgi:hypothetical protein